MDPVVLPPGGGSPPVAPASAVGRLIALLDPVQWAGLLVLAAVFAVLLVTGPGQTEGARLADRAGIADATGEATTQVPSSPRTLLFHHPQCPHCEEARHWLARQPPAVSDQVDPIDVSTPGGQEAIVLMGRRHGIEPADLTVPWLVGPGGEAMGFESDLTSGPVWSAVIQGQPSPMAATTDTAPPDDALRRLDLPLVGEVDVSGVSLPLLTVVLAAADGFNPCAMWVLVYLISVIAGLKDRTRIWMLVGTFLLASGILYALFMTAWLNTFLLIGYTRPLTLLIALSAIGFGLNHLYGVVRSRGQVTCEVGDLRAHQRTRTRIQAAVAAPLGVASVMAMIGLAFAVNAIEFACSAALPAIYTHTLSLLDLSAPAYAGYIGLYVLVFMADDLIIFSLAILAVQRVLDSRYAAVSRLIGGVLMIGLGGWMISR